MSTRQWVSGIVCMLLLVAIYGGRALADYRERKRDRERVRRTLNQ